MSDFGFVAEQPKKLTSRLLSRRNAAFLFAALVLPALAKIADQAPPLANAANQSLETIAASQALPINFDTDASLKNIPAEDGITPQVSFFTTSDGLKLRYAEFASNDSSKGIILLSPGKGGTIENFQSLATAYAKDGWKVFALEPRNQGGSGRELHDTQKVHVTSFDQYRNDATDFVTKVINPQRAKGKPFVVVAHSMSGGFMTPALVENKFNADGFVAMAPMLEATKLPVSGFKGLATEGFVDAKAFLEGQKATGDNLGIWPHTGDNNPYTNYSPDFVKWQKTLKDHPKLETRDATYSWASAAIDNSDKINALPPNSISVPAKFILAGEDSIVNNDATQKIVSTKFENATVSEINGAKHELALGGPRVIKQIVAETNELAQSLEVGIPARPAARVVAKPTTLTNSKG